MRSILSKTCPISISDPANNFMAITKRLNDGLQDATESFMTKTQGP